MNREMKHSGIEWIGEIPKEWIPARFKYSGCFIKGKLPATQNNENKGFPVIGASEMLGKEPRLYTEDSNIPMCSDEDILILWDGANAGIIANKCKGIVSSTAVKYSCTDKRFNKQYMFYLLKNAEPFFKSKVGGTTIPHMNTRYIDEYLCILPPLSEQQKIANYLDKVCGEVDEMITLQEQMIEELKAYKQSVITEAVTKGLNPDAPMKDSGIDWIGEVPKHWEKDKIIRIFNLIGSGTTPSSSDNEAYEGNLNWIQSGDINGGDLYDSKNKISEKTLAKYSALTMYDAPFIIIAMYGASVGNISISHINGCVNQACCVISKTKQDFKYVFYAIKSAKNYLIYKAVGGGQPNISQSTLKQLWLPVPPLSEQQSIASYLDTKCAEIDALIAIKQAKIDELKDYKKSVIYEYVTGKKEVVWIQKQ